VVGYTVCVPEEPESTALGAAILAGVGLGVFRDTREACATMVRMRGSRVPDPANFARYRTIFEEVYLPFSAASLGLSARLRAIAESGRG
jgi:sugar (pentulose or hexulose) kinase